MAEQFRFGFVTCVQLGLDVMEEIYAVGGRLCLAMTLPDDVSTTKSGRVFIDEFCSQRDIPLIKSRSVNDPEVVEAIVDSNIDWLLIIGWSQIARPTILNAPKKGCIGMHPTLLPEGRGRASIPWAILKGLDETGVTMFVLDEGVDTGPILAQSKIAIAHATSASDLYRDVQEAHRKLIRETWHDLSNGDLAARPQDPSAGSTWPARSPEDGRIRPDMTVEEILRLVRATTRPYPGAFWESADGIVRAWNARQVSTSGDLPWMQCSDGIVEATEYDTERESADAR